ncbi:MAG: transporter [Sandaracinaceae bacterium]
MVLISSLVLASTASVAVAQEGTLPPTFTSDRPGFANTTGVAAREHLTAEMGVSASFGDTPSGALPNLSLRTGLFDWLEARVRGPSAAGVFPASGAVFGMSDPSLGFKVGGRLADSLTMSLDWEVSLPLGTTGFGAPEATFFADLNADWNFWGPLTLTPNLVASVLADVDATTGETVRWFEGGGSLKLTWQVIEVLGLFVQGYAIASERADLRVTIGGGIYWMVAPNVQVDASFDAGVTDGGDPPTVGLGTTILF